MFQNRNNGLSLYHSLKWFESQGSHVRRNAAGVEQVRSQRSNNPYFLRTSVKDMNYKE